MQEALFKFLIFLLGYIPKVFIHTYVHIIEYVYLQNGFMPIKISYK